MTFATDQLTGPRAGHERLLGVFLVSAPAGASLEPYVCPGSRCLATCARLAREFGLFVGPSSDAHLAAARDLQARHPGLQHVVTFFYDEGEKYINDYFLGA